MSWNPLHDTLLSSSILAEGPDVVSVFAILVASADRFGNSDVTIPFVASILRISDERADAAFKVLLSPDPKSRNKQQEGRRIVPLAEGGWHLVSHEKYRQRASRDAAAARQAKHAEKVKTEGCERVGCRRVAAGAVDGMMLCSKHALLMGEGE